MKQCQSKRGFTLLEIMIVCGIVAILASIAIPSFMEARRISRENSARNDVRVISASIEYLAFDSGQWPGGMAANEPTSAESWDLTHGSAGLLGNDGTFGTWSGPYIEKILSDPWGMLYFFDPDYRISGVDYVVVGSFGMNRLGPNVYDSDNVYAMQE